MAPPVLEVASVAQADAIDPDSTIRHMQIMVQRSLQSTALTPRSQNSQCFHLFDMGPYFEEGTGGGVWVLAGVEVHLETGGPHGLHELLGRAGDSVFCGPVCSPVGTRHRGVLPFGQPSHSRGKHLHRTNTA